MAVLRIGLIGAGWVAAHHLAGWRREAARAEVVAIADPSLSRAGQRAREFGIERCYPSAEAMLASERLDAVDIVASREAHVPLVRQAQLSSGLLADATGAFPALVKQPFIAALERALVMETLIHHIDTLRFLLGEMALVQARLGQGCTVTKGEDRASLAFQTAHGTSVAVHADLCVAGEPAALVDRLRLIGDIGTIRLDGDALVCRGDAPASLRFDAEAGYADSYAAAIRHFVDCLGSGAAFETGLDDNLETLRLVEQVYADAAGQRPTAPQWRIL